MGKKIYARQIPPEYQESPLYWNYNRKDGLDLRDTWPEITLTGNGHFCGYKTELFEAAERIDDAADEYTNGQEWTGERVRIVDALRDYGIEKQNRKKWTPRELGQFKRIFQSWDRNPWDGRNADARIVETLELMTGRPWDVETLRGCSQGDYIDCYYPRDKYSPQDLERLEMEYFNTGEEWTVFEEDPDENPDADHFSMYIYSWKDDEKRQEIADASGWGTPEEVELHAFTGWTRSACYA